MAAVEVTISGMLYDKINKTQQNVVLIGEAFLTGLGVGGGPMPPVPIPPKPIDPGPPVIWPGPGPIYPIMPHPEHPIVLPPPPDKPPPVDPPTQPPDTHWEWGWSPAHGWHPVYVPGDKPQPVPPA